MHCAKIVILVLLSPGIVDNLGLLHGHVTCGAHRSLALIVAKRLVQGRTAVLAYVVAACIVHLG